MLSFPYVIDLKIRDARVILFVDFFMYTNFLQFLQLTYL